MAQAQKPHERIYVAIDTPSAERALELAAALAGKVGGFKIGLELFTHHGPALVRKIAASGIDIFLDLKLHDIPNTVAGAAAAVGHLGVRLFTVHAMGGPKMIARATAAADAAAREAGHAPPTLLAVTVLTSHDDDELAAVGLAGPCGAAVLRLADMARDAGAGGLVCSPQEVGAVRARFPSGTLVVPGIRLADATVRDDDQARVGSPGRTVAAGADILVIGRPITRADDPAAAADRIAAAIARGE